ncbi:MAG: hypothetical protein RLZZ549_1276, partial [Pseudomonadota bacterium]
IILPHAAVAQLDRVLGYEPRGRGFESCQPRHILTICQTGKLRKATIVCFNS